MNILNEFAKAALTGLLANPYYREKEIDQICTDAWTMAKEMVDQRPKTTCEACGVKDVPLSPSGEMMVCKACLYRIDMGKKIM